MSIGIWQIAIVVILVVLLFGRGKISSLMGDVAKGIKSFKKGMASDVTDESEPKNIGGVWADATMLCMQPLDNWVYEKVEPAGMWMYHGPGAGMPKEIGPEIWFIV